MMKKALFTQLCYAAFPVGFFAQSLTSERYYTRIRSSNSLGNYRDVASVDRRADFVLVFSEMVAYGLAFQEENCNCS